MVEQAKEWEIMGYDVRETRSAAEGFEVMSEKVKIIKKSCIDISLSNNFRSILN